jgi:hypothetical protein
MKESTAGRGTKAITLLITALCGGLGGSVLTNYLASRSTTIEYTINRTALGTDQTAVIPDFKVGGTPLQALYIYSVKFQYSSGPELEGAKVGIDLSTPNVKLIGKTVPEGPSEVFRITCDSFEGRAKSSGTTCSVGRLSSNVGAYTVSFATDTDVTILLSIDAKNAQIKQAGVPGARTTDYSQIILFGILSGMLTAILASVGSYYFRRHSSDRNLDELSDALAFNAGTSQPKLEIDFEGTPGANIVDAHYKRKDGTDVDDIYIRVRVRNLGQRTAKGSRVFLTTLQEVQPTGATITEIYDSLSLPWAGWAFEPRDIPPGVSFYADLMRVSRHTEGWIFSAEKKFAIKAALEQYSGTYRFRVTTTADNAAPAICEVDVTYKQDWHTLKAVAVQRTTR